MLFFDPYPCIAVVDPHFRRRPGNAGLVAVILLAPAALAYGSALTAILRSPLFSARAERSATHAPAGRHARR